MNIHTITSRPLTPKELAFVRLLERQRCVAGFVRVFAHDPHGELTRVACEYIAWFQTKIDARDALVFTPAKSPKLPIPRVFQAAARSFRKHQGKTLCIGQALLFGADAYCPSVPLWRNYFDQMFSLACGYLNLHGTVLIVLGNAEARRGRTRFARLYRQLRDGSDDFYAIFDASIEPASKPKAIVHITRPKRFRVILLHGKAEVLHHVPYRPRGAPIAA